MPDGLRSEIRTETLPASGVIVEFDAARFADWSRPTETPRSLLAVEGVPVKINVVLKGSAPESIHIFVVSKPRD